MVVWLSRLKLIQTPALGTVPREYVRSVALRLFDNAQFASMIEIGCTPVLSSHLTSLSEEEVHGADEIELHR